MMTKRTALLAASAAVLVTLEGGGVARAADANWALNYDGSLRWDAVRGGVDSDGSPLYFCRAYLSPGFQPGKVNFNLGSCRYPYGGQEQKDLVYDVLVPHWESASNGQPAGSPYQAGFDTDGTSLYFCRAGYLGGLQPGKLKAGAGCYIGYGGNEILFKNYEVLQGDLPMTLTILNGDSITEIIGGYEANGNNLSLCVANYHASLQPGKFLAADGECHFSYGGREVLSNDFYLLHLNTSDIFGFSFQYDFPVGEDTDRDPLYACRTHISADGNRSTQLGKYQLLFRSCHVSWGGKNGRATVLIMRWMD